MEIIAGDSRPAVCENSIRKLPEDVINRIAAGEVVVRPSAALKELLENSLDAAATSITVTAKDGGLKSLQIVDDGSGISKEDLPLLCERFATSKISRFDDLETVSTFGFRGEALASISHVARLSVLTKTKHSNVAYKASYLDGALKSQPTATAGVQGTTITVEDMFYNLPTRRRALRSSSDEYRAIVDVMTRYSIRYPKVAFICRRHQRGSSRLASVADVRTSRLSTVENNIRAGFGSLSHETFSLNVAVKEANASVSLVASRATFSMKKGVFILFINGRLVDCLPFKKAIWGLYSSYLPKNGYPFVYVDLSMEQKDIDVNVHPTKKEVRFLHEVSIVGAVIEALGKQLKSAESSRLFQTQTLGSAATSTSQAVLKPIGNAITVVPRISENASNLSAEPRRQDYSSAESPNKTDMDKEQVEKGHDSSEEEIVAVGTVEAHDNEGSIDIDREYSPRQPLKRKAQHVDPYSGTGVLSRPSSSMSKPKLYPKDRVRTGSSAPVGLYDVFLSTQDAKDAAISIQKKRRRRLNAIPLLTSVESLLDRERKSSHMGLSQILKEHLFVGVASPRFVLVQHQTKLILADVEPLLKQLMYQQSLIRFADFEAFHLDPPAPIMQLINNYLSTNPEELVERRINAESCAMILLEKSSMLDEYYSISMEGDSPEDLCLKSLPLIIPEVVPDFRYTGYFLYHLAAGTDWSEEEPCFQGISKALSDWYGAHWNPMPTAPSTTNLNQAQGSSAERGGESPR
ncbi:DNA mismatch repair protein Mlh1 [Gracilariopsis chorda]|uniref:DNA mismatch repair protein Mlh1 n=1 Tax=Gracilariopsis chorda TaxID=448386 RepID=A0A2V3J0B2_9FLOR|nr:DNA mismatch repair protein Mlh1 [Gracilariopsis chorda]|eukprot:PXF47765.1 DNA mismatch repair protein Mlh1 [Gracilariopsis chorda]